MSSYEHTTYHQRKTYKDKIRERDNYTCQLCGQPGREVDHIIPYAISHDSSPTNLRCLCKACNLATRRQRYDAAMPDDEWEVYARAELARLKSLGIP